MQFLFEKIIPQSVLDGQKRHQRYAFDRINRRLDSKTDRLDFMTPFMKRNPNFEKMSRDEIFSSFSFIIVGGSETSATAMTGMFNHLAMSRNREILDRLTREIRAAYKREDEITLRNIDNKNCLPAGLPRMVPAGGDENAGFWLPEGTRLGVRIYVVNRSSKYFHDPDTFVPERWLALGDRPDAFVNDCLTACKPFSIGFHSCLGKPLAWLEMRLVLTRILWAFDIAEEEGMQVHFDDFPMMMMVEKQPLFLRLRSRSGVNNKASPST